MQSARIMSLPIHHLKSDPQPRPSPWAPPLRAWRVGARPDEGQVSNLTSSHKNTIHEKQSAYLAFSWFHTTKVRLGEFSCFTFFGNLPRAIGLRGGGGGQSRREGVANRTSVWVCASLPSPPGPGQCGHSPWFSF